jgi:hypothetical protein
MKGTRHWPFSAVQQASTPQRLHQNEVKYATQVLSHSVSSTMLMMVSLGAILHSATLIFKYNLSLVKSDCHFILTMYMMIPQFAQFQKPFTFNSIFKT